MLPVILFVVGMVMLLVATNQLITLATRLAHSLKLSPLIIGVTVVALGTSLPELVVSTIASVEGDYGLAVGNVFGSNIINILLVLGIGCLTGKIAVGTTKTQRNISILLFASLLYVASFWLRLPGLVTALVLVGLMLLFTITQYRWGIAGRNLEDKIMLKISKKKKLSTYEYLLIGLCLVCIFVGGNLIVSSVENIALMTGFSTNILGLSITSIATSLPEIMATIIGIHQREDKLLLGNIMGSNIYNILFIGGVSSFWIKNYQLPLFEVLFFLVSTFLFFGIIRYYKGKKIPQFVGLGLFIVSVCYFVGMYYQRI